MEDLPNSPLVSRPITRRSLLALTGATAGVWILWQLWGVEIMRTPWEDEILYVLPAVNWVRNGVLAIPQLGNFAGSDQTWGWHVPGFTLGMAIWLKFFPLELWAVRLYSVLAAAGVCFLLSLLAQRARAAISPVAVILWLPVIFFDKTMVSQSITGRMEFHAGLLLLASIVTIIVAKKGSKRRTKLFAAFGSGLFFGLSAAFHPITIYFAPALITATALSPAMREMGMKRAFLLLFLGAVIPLTAVSGWFYYMGPIARQQFMLSVSGSSAVSTKGTLQTVFDTLFFAYRFQPLMIGALVLVIFALALTCYRVFQDGRRVKLRLPDRLLVVSVIAIACFAFGILRGSTQNLNYYVLFSVFSLTSFIAAFSIVIHLESGRLRIAAVAILIAVAINNTAFAAFKTYVVARNLAEWDPACMKAFLNTYTANLHGTYVLPPNLWLYAEQQRLRWRVSYLTLTGQPQSVYSEYSEKTLRSSPVVVILDEQDWPERQITKSYLFKHGLNSKANFGHTFLHRSPYANGWHLKVYQ